LIRHLQDYQHNGLKCQFGVRVNYFWNHQLELQERACQDYYPNIYKASDLRKKLVTSLGYSFKQVVGTGWRGIIIFLKSFIGWEKLLEGSEKLMCHPDPLAGGEGSQIVMLFMIFYKV